MRTYNRYPLYKMFADGTWAKQTRGGSMRMIPQEKIPTAHWEKICVLVHVSDAHWIAGVGGVVRITVPVRQTYFYVEI